MGTELRSLAEFAPRPETVEDAGEIESLYDAVFGLSRQTLSSYQLRRGVDPVAGLGFVLRDESAVLVGAIRFWPVRVGGRPALLVGPVGVHPTRQGEGLGGLLIRHGLAEAAVAPMPPATGEAGNWSRALLVGDEPYYGQFGFRRDLAAGLEFPPPTNPARVLAQELQPGAMAGVAGPVQLWNPPAGK